MSSKGSMMAKRDSIYKVLFIQSKQVYEVYAKYISEEVLAGFIELEELVFSNPSSIVVDPSEEKLKAEFADVSRVYIPMHTVLRIDEVKSVGAAKVYDSNHKSTDHFSDNMIKMPQAFHLPPEKETEKE
jgi:hypothetical protein